MKSLIAIAAQTVLEIVRARVLHALLVFLVVLAWGSLFVGDLSFESRSEIAIDLSLTGVGLFCSVCAILLALEFVGVVVRPVVWPLLASGISRAELLLGRFLGVALVTVSLSIVAPLLLMLLFFLLGYDPENRTDLMHALILMPLENLIWTSACSAFAIIAPRALALAMAFGYWAVSNLHHHPFSYGALRDDWQGTVGVYLGVFLPDIEFYNARLLEHFTPRVVAVAATQSFAFCLAFLAVALLFFRRRDL